MRHLLPIASSIAVLLLAACAKDAPDPAEQASAPSSAEPSASPAAPAEPRMAALLDSSNIGRRLDVFERKIGAPDDAGADWASYTVDGCPVRVTSKDNVVTWIEIRISGENCEVPLKPLLGADRVVGTDAPLTFGQFDFLSNGGTFYSHPCGGLDCGNALDPYLIVVNPGVHANNFIDVEATSMNYDYDLFFAWREAVTAQSGEEYFMGDLECDRQYDELSRKMLAAVTIDAIAFGHRRPGNCR